MHRAAGKAIYAGLVIAVILISANGCGNSSTGASLDELAESVDLDNVKETSSESLQTADSVAVGDVLDLEKDKLKFGFIKLTDCAPIVIAKEKGVVIGKFGVDLLSAS